MLVFVLVHPVGRRSVLLLRGAIVTTLSPLLLVLLQVATLAIVLAAPFIGAAIYLHLALVLLLLHELVLGIFLDRQ